VTENGGVLRSTGFGIWKAPEEGRGRGKGKREGRGRREKGQLEVGRSSTRSRDSRLEMGLTRMI
jgi:hypothetical protein